MKLLSGAHVSETAVQTAAVQMISNDTEHKVSCTFWFAAQAPPFFLCDAGIDVDH